MNVLEHALRYANLGYRIAPIPPGQKYPSMKAWQQHATTDPDTIRAWWQGEYANCGIGIVTGTWNGRTLFVVDIDDKEGKTGSETIHDLETRHGPLPDTLSAQTGSGGRHLYFVTDQDIHNSAELLGPGVDIRGHNGQVLAPPTVHPNGKPYQWMIDAPKTPAEAPDWLIQLIKPKPITIDPPRQPADRDVFLDKANGDSVADRYNASVTWEELLTADGWTCKSMDASGEKHWVRPGKNEREGTSATTFYKGIDILRVFTTSIPQLPPQAYSKFQYTANMHHGGDMSAFARSLVGKTITSDPIAQPVLESMFIDWPTFWTEQFPDEDWIAKPLIPRHHHVALYAKGGTGKSLVALWVAKQLASGQPIFGHATPPINVLYMDFEMTRQILQERLKAMGASADTDLTRLHYALLPPTLPMDTADGGKQIAEIARMVQADLVIIDTFGRAVEGEENSADTIRNYYRHTGLPLKKEGRALLRIDHAGKDAARGQRGSSGKNDDVDLVWELTRDGNDLILKRHKHRPTWIPERVTMRLGEGQDFLNLADTGRDTFTLATQALLDAQAAPPRSQNQAVQMVTLYYTNRNQQMPFSEKQLRAAYNNLLKQHEERLNAQALDQGF